MQNLPDQFGLVLAGRARNRFEHQVRFGSDLAAAVDELGHGSQERDARRARYADVTGVCDRSERAGIELRGLDSGEPAVQLAPPIPASDGCDYAVFESLGEGLGPLADSGRRDADRFGNVFDVAAEQLDCGGLEHRDRRLARLRFNWKPANEKSLLNRGAMPTLEERIKELMDAMGWDVPRVAAIAGVSQSAVSQWIGKGSKEIYSIGNLEAALLLERASGFSALWLAKGKGPKLVGNTRLGHTVYSVKNVTALPEPFDQSSFDALPEQQQQDVAKLTAGIVDAFTRYNAPPPSSEGKRQWSKRAPGEKQAAIGPRMQSPSRKRGSR